MEKEDPSDDEFIVPEKLKELVLSWRLWSVRR